MQLDWARELLAPHGVASKKVWEKLLNELAHQIIKSNLGMATLGSLDFFYLGDNRFQDSLGFELKSKGPSFLKTFGIFDVSDKFFEVHNAGEKKNNGSQPVKVTRMIWGLTKRGWLLVEVEFEAVRDGEDLYYEKPVSHSGRYVEVPELLKYVHQRQIVAVLDRQITNWYAKYQKEFKAAQALVENTEETLKFARSVAH